MTPVTIDHRRPRLTFVLTTSTSVMFLFGQLEYLQSHGFDVSVVSSFGAELELAREKGASVFAVPMRREISLANDAFSLWRLWRVIRKIRPDLTIVGTPKAGLFGGLAAVLAGVPNRIYTLHGLRLETTSGWKRRLLVSSERLACLCAHSVHCVSPSLRNRAVELGIVAPSKTEVIGPGTCGGVDTERFSSGLDAIERARALRKELDIPKGAPVIGFVGRFTRDKGIEELYSAFAKLRKSYPELRLLLVGEFEPGDPLPADIRAHIEADPMVIRTGFVSDTAPHYLTMDVCVLPTYREGFPGVPLEAQASGIPVVTTDATGAVDSVQHEKTGLIVPVGNVDALCVGIGRLLSDPTLRKRMGEDGRKWVTADFRSGIVWAAMRTKYEKQMSSRSVNRQRGWQKLMKSSFDRTFAFCGLLLLWPLLPVIALTVLVALGHPVLFRQRRPGLYGRSFEILKFRTMSDARDVRGNLLPDDMRMGRIGRLIRAMSLDELPQLWNVLKGDLSLVGPRPLLMQYLERYTPTQARRHEVMPGITGWAQINGRNAASWEQKFAYDVWYVENWSFWLDLKILVLTLWKTFRREGISKDGHVTMPEFTGYRQPRAGQAE